ncbi:IclR family transcriptional regulator [Streptomyces sp. NPDC051907]|uniref:IclR family transcriptional regulator n=1 Tax=Streptomyces sp. NPDC051907 TaxID=3155284 RepID=UPI00343B95D5
MVQAVQRAVQILRELATDGPRLGVTDLADRLGVAKPTAHALLRTLEGEGLVLQDQETGKYRLGPNLLRLGGAYLQGQELRTRSLAWSDLLAAQVGEAVLVGVLTGREIVVVHHAFRPEGPVQISEVGSSIPWNTCALGKAVVAHLPQALHDELLAGPLEALTDSSVQDGDELSKELDEARKVGYALEDREAVIGEAAVASPVFDHSGLVVGAIAVTGPFERLLTDDRRQDLAVAVRGTARNLSRDLGSPRGTPRR